jgi:hypothetical protein
MTEVLESPRWQAVGLVIDQNQRDFLAGRYTLADDLVAWFKAVDLFRDAADERMVLQEPTPTDLRQHKTWIASLVAEGERLMTEALKAGAEKAVKPDEIQATLDLLYLWQREWHGPKLPPERRRELLKAVFHVEESAA